MLVRHPEEQQKKQQNMFTVRDFSIEYFHHSSYQSFLRHDTVHRVPQARQVPVYLTSFKDSLCS